MHRSLSDQNAYIDGHKAALLYKYYRQFSNSYVERPIPVESIRAKSFYLQHKKTFDNLVHVLAKNHISIPKYLEYAAGSLQISPKLIDSSLCTFSSIRKFVEETAIRAQYHKAYLQLLKSAENIADECIQKGYPRAVDLFKELIYSQRLAAYYVAGKISKYFFAAIPKFVDIVKKLDPISRDEFSHLCSMFEKYSIDIKEALRRENQQQQTGFQIADFIIRKKKQKC